MYNMESRPLSGEEKLIEKSVDFHSNSDTHNQIIASQRYHPNIVECESLLINKHKNNDSIAITIKKTGTGQTEKYKNDKTVSNVNEILQNNSKGDNTHVCNEKTQVLKEVTKPTKKSSEKSKTKRTFSLLDPLISVSILGPSAIAVWRGVWGYMDLHTELFPGWFCFLFGTALHITFAIFKSRFHDTYTDKWIELNWLKRLPYRALRILYTYTFGVACITHWRGGWIIIDHFLFTHLWITATSTCLLMACLAILRCIRNLIATPMIIIIDVPSCVFQFPTRYNVIHVTNTPLIAKIAIYMVRYDNTFRYV
ncbi:uncharacterized protein LOC114942311 [Nylanderia fulva]|uniref:uncharacterized protein LOC114942311 n=1 Tax=Nylanderia fulva TaxID=613905 RepID=UPI0010FB295E|nr:uncharacterized protein LOC114942311 [Nylanderia fulva]